MDRHERVLYHQIHPLKLFTDIATAAIAGTLLWRHRLILAALVGLVPSMVVSAALMRWADLRYYRRSRIGRYISRFMTRWVELARLAGLVPLWGGAWMHRAGVVVTGVVWICGCWLLGLWRSPPARPAS